MASPDRAAHVAGRLIECTGLSVFDAAGPELPDAIAEKWPGLSRAEVHRAIAIFVEVRRADDDFDRYGWRDDCPG